VNALSPPAATGAPSEATLVARFAVQNAPYYERVFDRIRRSPRRVWPFNISAALLGPVWAAARGTAVLFWIVFFLEMLAVVQIGVGLSGNLGAAEQARAERLTKQALDRAAQAETAQQAGAENAAGLASSAAALQRAAQAAVETAEAAGARGPLVVGLGISTLVLARLLAGFLANRMLELRFTRWQSNPSIHHGLNYPLALGTLAFCIVAYGLSIYRFASASPPAWLAAAPSNRDWQAALSSYLDDLMRAVADAGGVFFGAVTGLITLVLDAFAYALTGTPWLVTMAVILILAWQLAGPRVAIFSAAALAYLALLGFWEKSLETVALLGTSAALCLIIGLPLGIWCGRRPRVYAALRPVLDFMQTMPAFVYLIPVIALFGIGKPPGVIATLIFGTPPIVRLTALGLQGVPENIREAAQAYGATRWFLLTRVDLPLAMPSIMAGVNQTILMCLSMVVVASLIGAKGLGEDVLNALQYAAVGQGLLAGLAILLCAMIIDRIVQGRAARYD
jgi:glycine betaine/proline transport system permease protein